MRTEVGETVRQTLRSYNQADFPQILLKEVSQTTLIFSFIGIGDSVSTGIGAISNRSTNSNRFGLLFEPTGYYLNRPSLKIYPNTISNR